MENKKKDLKKLSKENIGDVSGGWYVKEGVEDHINYSFWVLEVFNDNGEYLGNSISFADAEILAKKHNCTNFELNKSSLGRFHDDYEETIRQHKFWH